MNRRATSKTGNRRWDYLGHTSANVRRSPDPNKIRRKPPGQGKKWENKTNEKEKKQRIDPYYETLTDALTVADRLDVNCHANPVSSSRQK